VGEAANRKQVADDLFMEQADAPKPSVPGGTPPRGSTALFGALNACLAIAIAVLLALGLRVHSQYGEFLRMREVVDKQTFYEGTTVEGVDVSRMTLTNAMDYWRNRVEARNAERTVTLDDGTAITAGALGYTSDYESVLTTAWSHGRSGTLEERYRMASSRMLSKKELTDRLRRKGADPDEAAEAAERMEELGAVNDSAYAGVVVRHYAAMGYGRGRVEQELYRRGIPKELWEDALRELPDSADAIDAFLRSKLKGRQPDRAELKRLSDALLRRGYSWNEIRPALNRLGETEIEE
jgi:regulatory protein